MPDPQTPTTLAQVLGAVLAVLVGGGGVKGFDRWRRRNSSGHPSRDADHVAKAIRKSTEEITGEIRALSDKTGEMHGDVKILLDRGTRP